MDILNDLSDEEVREWLYRLQLDDLPMLKTYNRQKALGAIECMMRAAKEEGEDEELIEFFTSRRNRKCTNEYTYSGFQTNEFSDERLLLIKQNGQVYCFDKNGDLAPANKLRAFRLLNR